MQGCYDNYSENIDGTTTTETANLSNGDTEQHGESKKSPVKLKWKKRRTGISGGSQWGEAFVLW